MSRFVTMLMVCAFASFGHGVRVVKRRQKSDDSGAKAAADVGQEHQAAEELSDATPAGYMSAGSNCNCGDSRVKLWSQGYSSADACAAQCTAEPLCKSFGLWDKGLCALFDGACMDTCPNPTNFANGYTNTVYNKGQPVIGSSGTMDVLGEPLTVRECQEAASQLGKSFDKEEDVDDYPPGCYVYRGSHSQWSAMYFNKHPAGTANHDAARVFRRAPAPWTQHLCVIEEQLLIETADFTPEAYPQEDRAEECAAACLSHSDARCCRINYDWTPARCHYGTASLDTTQNGSKGHRAFNIEAAETGSFDNIAK